VRACGRGRQALDREVRGHLKTLITRDLDSKTADSVFQQAGSPPKWLEEMVLAPEWQDMLYELSEAHPGSILMAYAMERIGEVRGISAEKAGAETAASNLRIFETVLKEAVEALVAPGRPVAPEHLQVPPSRRAAPRHAARGRGG
jgi:hypothetical protein